MLVLRGYDVGYGCQKISHVMRCCFPRNGLLELMRPRRLLDEMVNHPGHATYPSDCEVS
jgi:hypothetical protein